MKKLVSAALAFLLVLTPVLVFAADYTAQGPYTDGVYQGEAEGYLGPVKVSVTIEGGAITAVTVLESSDTEGIFAGAQSGVVDAVLQANTVTGVDTVSGATYSSKGLLGAIAAALEAAGAEVSMPAEVADTPAGLPAAGSGTVSLGLGSVANYRKGPGTDETETQVYSFNVTMAAVLFDEDGRILNMEVDIYEIGTPNAKGATMPHFSGWPGTEGYNVFDHETGTISGLSENTEELAAAEINAWATKRERGDSYAMNVQNEWYEQMDAYEDYFIGWTVAEVRAWFTKYTSQRNGRPIKPTSDNEADLVVLEQLTDDEKAMLTDATSRATMSLSDSHGLILEAIEKAYENRKDVLTIGD